MKYSFLDRHGQYSADYLGLSLAGAIKLAPYSEECHEEALDSYISAADKKKISIKDPIKFYIYLCNDYCKNRYIDPDYTALTRLAAQHNIDAQTLVYLPPEQRVTVQPKSTPEKQPKKYEGNPYKQPTGTWIKSQQAFPFSPQCKLDDIAEAIKIAAYIAAGIMNESGARFVPPLECFTKRAAYAVQQLVIQHKNYDLDIPTLVQAIDTFIDYKSNLLAIPAEDAKVKAHQAIAQITPVLLKPLREKGTMPC
jgi:hypothetical protein